MASTLSPKDATEVRVNAYPKEIRYSALTRSYGSTKAPSSNVDIAVCFKPTNAQWGALLQDETNHYLLHIQKTGTIANVYCYGQYIGNTAVLKNEHVWSILHKALSAVCGNYAGYYSNVHVVDGSLHVYSTYYEQSDKVPGLWVCKRNLKIDYGAAGGFYNFADASFLGKDVSGKGNHWTVNGTQSDDTPTHNGGKAVWEALPEPTIWPHEHFFQTSFTAHASQPQRITVPWNMADEKWIMQLSTQDGEFFEWYDSERGLKYVAWRMDSNNEHDIKGDVTAYDHNKLSIHPNVTKAGKKYNVTIWRCAPDSPFDVVRINHTSGIETVFNHACRARPNFIIQKGVYGPCYNAPIVYNQSRGVNRYKPEVGTPPWTHLSGCWEPLTQTRASINANWGTGTYVVYLFAPPLSYVTPTYTGTRSVDGPEWNCGGQPGFIWWDFNYSGWAGLWTDAPRNNFRSSWSKFQYLTGHAASHEVADMVRIRSNGWKITNSEYQLNSSGANANDSWTCLSGTFKYSNAVI